MILNIISDLHGVYNRGHHYGSSVIANFASGFKAENLKPCDTLVVAGDLGCSGMNTKYVLQEIEKYKSVNFKDIVWVPGNHDYYCDMYQYYGHYEYPMNECPKQYNAFNIFFKEIKIGDILFIVFPMWSPVYDNQGYVKQWLNDYKYIPNFTIENNNDLFSKYIDGLVNSLEKHKDEKKIVIVTHHVPLPELIHDKFIGNKANEAFTVMHSDKKHGSIKDIVSKYDNIKLWVHGHSHQFMDRTIDGIRYIRNPIGYSSYGVNECDFKYDCLVEV